MDMWIDPVSPNRSSASCCWHILLSHRYMMSWEARWRGFCGGWQGFCCCCCCCCCCCSCCLLLIKIYSSFFLVYLACRTFTFWRTESSNSLSCRFQILHFSHISTIHNHFQIVLQLYTSYLCFPYLYLPIQSKQRSPDLSGSNTLHYAATFKQNEVLEILLQSSQVSGRYFRKGLATCCG